MNATVPGSFAVVAALVFAIVPGIAQQPTEAAKPPPSINAAAATAAPAKRIDPKTLLESDSFTNDTGIVMVKISPSLWAGKYEVTQEEYQKVAGGNPSQFPGDRNPVDSVSWSEAISFCQQLTEAEKKAEMLPEGFGYQLPTQSQWESLLGGATTADAVTSESTTRSGPAPVGSLRPNSLQLHDVRGNVQEWCLDPQDKPFRVLRGGAWDTRVETNLRPEFRWYSKGPDDRQSSYGLRVVMVRSGESPPPTE